MLKKATFILAVVSCLLLSSCASDESVVYLIQESVLSPGYTGPETGEARELYNHFIADVQEFNKENESNFRWIETVKGERYDKTDKTAVEFFNLALKGRKAINEEYEAKFAKCTDKSVTISMVSEFKISRIATRSKVLSSEELVFKYPKSE